MNRGILAVSYRETCRAKPEAGERGSELWARHLPGRWRLRGLLAGP